ncbi:MAG: hypothetical protein FWE71_17040, partial [Nocardioidaceae bacterium]|nr:hypothetical protein [Nocardioidaceae bacterium]MCL2614313.1 hypothetical protein [Nocardioidaceae bacterium]
MGEPDTNVATGRGLREITGAGEDPQPQLGQLGLDPRERTQSHSLLGRGQVDRGHVGDSSQLGFQLLGAVEQRV